VHRDDLDGMAQVTKSVSTPILADESVWTVRNLPELLRLGAMDMVNIKLAKTGGLREAFELGRVAAQNGVKVIVGCMVESHVGVASAAALASALTGSAPGSGAAQDLDAGLWLSRSPVRGGVTYDRDMVHLTQLPARASNR